MTRRTTAIVASYAAAGLLAAGCGDLRPGGRVAEEAATGRHMEELAQYLNEQKSRTVRTDYRALGDPFRRDLAAPVISHAPAPAARPSRIPPPPPKLQLGGIVRSDGRGTAFIDGAAYRTGDRAGPFFVADVGLRTVTVRRGGERFVVPIGESLWSASRQEGAR